MIYFELKFGLYVVRAAGFELELLWYQVEVLTTASKLRNCDES